MSYNSSPSSWVKSISSNNINGMLSSSGGGGSSGGGSNRSTVRGADKEQKLLGYLQKQSKSQLPNTNVKLYKKKWFWFEPDSGTLFYSTTSIGGAITTPTSLLENVKSIIITNSVIIEQSISFRLELIISDKINNKTYNLRANDELTVLNWVNALNQWKRINCNIEINNNNKSKSSTNLLSISSNTAIEKDNSNNNNNNNIVTDNIESLLNLMSITTTTTNNNSIKPIIEKIQPDSDQLKLILSQIEQQINYLKSCQIEILTYSGNNNSNGNSNNNSNNGTPQSSLSNSTLLKRFTNNYNNNSINSSVGSGDFSNNNLSFSNNILDESIIDDDEEEEDNYYAYENTITDIFQCLPQHLSLFVFSYLNATDLLIAAQVSVQWQRLANDNLLWIKFVKHFITPASVFDKSHNWKSVYLANTSGAIKIGSNGNNGQINNGSNGLVNGNSSSGSGGGGGKDKYMNRAISMYGINPLKSLSSSKEGWLYKRGDDLLRIWKKRYFVLRDCSLFYFKHQNDNFPCGVILLHGATRLKRASVSTRKNCFKILQSKQSGAPIINNKKRMPYYLSSDREDDCNDWMNLLLNSIKSNQQHQNNYGIINIGNNNNINNNNNNNNNGYNNNNYNNNCIGNNNNYNYNNNNNNNNSSGNLPPLLTKQSSFNNLNQFNTNLNSNTKGRKSHKKSFSSSSTSSNNNAFDPLLSTTTTIITPVQLKPIYPMFGIPISKILEYQSHIQTQSHLKIPFILYICLNHIISKGTLEEGIFRVSGSLREVQELQEDFEQGRDIDLNSHDIHAICGLVKTFFRKLPHTLVPSDLDEYSTSVQLATSQTEDEKISEYKFIFENISKNSFHIFELLLYLLRQIIKNESVNKMTQDNLLIVIMPNLPSVGGSIITNGIKYYDHIFINNK